ncbi:hypothetical protein GXM_07889 [Nostoc sphaeroides CCNUC1]|uniref:Uncharacterized protein n=1 Tax=Nostoc sphaeroides CCNUC1 TaxID=2653204 RepID=A0A5P8WC37_9NOSO|nr:hypothetical protein GXM_07889 [Nostoc sphaeroides CCNUC1]
MGAIANFEEIGLPFLQALNPLNLAEVLLLIPNFLLFSFPKALTAMFILLHHHLYSQCPF